MDGDMAAPGFTRYAALYIDVPNILTRGQGANRHRLHLTEIDWPDLISRMLESLGTERVRYQGGAYLFRRDKHELAQGEQELRAMLGSHNRALSVVASTQDIDARLISDMWADILTTYLELDRQQPEVCHQITILLASGDYIYAHAIGRMREAFRGKLDLRLHVFSWRTSLARDLKLASQQTYLLDY